MVTIAEVEFIAKQTTGADSARVLTMRDRNVWDGPQSFFESFYVLSVRHNGAATILGRRRTMVELLELAKRGPLQALR